MPSPYLNKPLRSLEQALAELAKRPRSPGPGGRVSTQRSAAFSQTAAEKEKSGRAALVPLRRTAKAA